MKYIKGMMIAKIKRIDMSIEIPRITRINKKIQFGIKTVSDFVSPAIKQQIRDWESSGKEYEVYEYKNIYITLCKYGDYNNISLKLLFKIVENMRRAFNEDRRKIDILLFLSPLPKTMKEFTSDGLDAAIESGNVNSAYCYTGSGEIVIYRREELIRTLIHECIHSLHGDMCVIQKAGSCKTNEAYTEYLTFMFLVNMKFTTAKKRINICYWRMFEIRQAIAK